MRCFDSVETIHFYNSKFLFSLCPKQFAKIDTNLLNVSVDPNLHFLVGGKKVLDEKFLTALL